MVGRIQESGISRSRDRDDMVDVLGWGVSLLDEAAAVRRHGRLWWAHAAERIARAEAARVLRPAAIVATLRGRTTSAVDSARMGYTVAGSHEGNAPWRCTRAQWRMRHDRGHRALGQRRLLEDRDCRTNELFHVERTITQPSSWPRVSLGRCAGNVVRSRPRSHRDAPGYERAGACL